MKDLLFKNGCYKSREKARTYFVYIKCDEHHEQMKFQRTDYFKEKAKHKKIESENSKLKNVHRKTQPVHAELPVCKCPFKDSSGK